MRAGRWSTGDWCWSIRAGCEPTIATLTEFNKNNMVQGDTDMTNQALTATITISKGRPTKFDNFAGGEDYDVLVSVGGKVIRGEISLAPDSANGGRMTSHGGTIDGWCSGSLVNWMHTLTPKSVRAVASSLQGGEGTEDVDVEVE